MKTLFSHESVPADPRFVGVGHYDEDPLNPIGWCARSTNYFIGCARASEGCALCYAPRSGIRQIRMGHHAYDDVVMILNGEPVWSGRRARSSLAMWKAPYIGTKHRLYFADSMTDLFYERHPDRDIVVALNAMWRARGHTFIVLTKRAERMARLLERLRMRDDLLVLESRPLPIMERAKFRNVWFGVSAENQTRADERLPFLRDVQTPVKLVSAEPLIGPLSVEKYPWLQWVICGGESAGVGGHFRAMDESWPRTLRDECVRLGIPYFFKQRSGVRPSAMPKDLDGQFWRQLPRRELDELPSRAERRSLVLWVEELYSALRRADCEDECANAAPAISGAGAVTSRETNVGTP